MEPGEGVYKYDMSRRRSMSVFFFAFAGVRALLSRSHQEIYEGCKFRLTGLRPN